MFSGTPKNLADEGIYSILIGVSDQFNKTQSLLTIEGELKNMHLLIIIICSFIVYDNAP